MVTRPATDRQILDLQKAESATAWIVFCGEMSHRDERTRTNLFLSICWQDAISKLRSLMAPRSLIDTSYKDIRLAIQIYIAPKERVVTAERAKFLSVIQGVGESDYDFLAGLREEARYCDFEKLRTAANPEEELVKIKFISGLRALKQNLDY